MPAGHGLTMQELRSLVVELNAERGRLDRALALADWDAATDAESSGGALATQSLTETQIQAAARRDALVVALQRVRDGTYGVCDRCGQQIPYGRLLVMPEVTHCVAC